MRQSTAVTTLTWEGQSRDVRRSVKSRVRERSAMDSCFSCVEQAPPVEVFALMKSFNDDPFPEKVNLGAGGQSSKLSMPKTVTKKNVGVC